MRLAIFSYRLAFGLIILGCSGCPMGPKPIHNEIVIVQGSPGLRRIVVDASNLYWTNEYRGTVTKIALSGGDPVILASGQNVPIGIAVDEDSVYWTNRAAIHSGSVGQVMKAPIQGGEPVVLYSQQPHPSKLVLSDGYLYWANGYGRPMKGSAHGGETPVELWSESIGGQADIVVTQQDIFWSADSAIWRKPKNSGEAIHIIKKEIYPGPLAIDGSYIYWASSRYGETVKKMAISGGEPITLATGQKYPHDIAIDEKAVYWSEGKSGAIRRVSLSGGEVVTLTEEQDDPQGIAVDSHYVYWVNRGSGTVCKVPKD